MYNALIAKLRNRAKHLAGNQSGFTLLELLVVVAILAAIAGTAVVALQDTDARASAAAHVAMMDELDKGIREFRVLNRNQYPDRFDSIMQAAAAVGATGAAQLDIAAHEDLGTAALATVFPAAADTADDPLTTHTDESAAGSLVVQRLNDIGIGTLRVAYDTATAGLDPDGSGDCDDYEALIADRGNAVVAGNIFLSPNANGCGGDHTIFEGSTVMMWAGGSERITGEPVATDLTITAGAVDLTGVSDGTPLMMAVGLGPSSTLFDKRSLGGLTTVPVYRHVGPTEYNRFTALFLLGETDAAAGVVTDQVLLMAIVDGAGDTKEEELGEWDGTRNTI